MNAVEHREAYTANLADIDRLQLQIDELKSTLEENRSKYDAIKAMLRMLAVSPEQNENIENMPRKPRP